MVASYLLYSCKMLLAIASYLIPLGQQLAFNLTDWGLHQFILDSKIYSHEPKHFGWLEFFNLLQYTHLIYCKYGNYLITILFICVLEIQNNPVGGVNHNCCIYSMLNRWINQQLLNSGEIKLGESMHIMLTKKSLWHNCCSCFKGWFIASLSICWNFIPLDLYVATLWLAGYCIRSYMRSFEVEKFQVLWKAQKF